MISREFRAWETNERQSLYITLSYYESDPWAVHMSFKNLDHAWVFARETLREGIRTGVTKGMGDVQVWNDCGSVFVKLSSPDGSNTFKFVKWEMRQFINQTCHVIKPGLENIDMDDLISELLKETNR